MTPEPSIGVPADVAARYRARYLDPATAPILAGQPTPRPTLHVADTLLVQGSHGDHAALDLLREAAKASGLSVELDERAYAENGRLLDEARIEGEAKARLAAVWTERVVLSKDSSTPTEPVDAWRLLLEYRSAVGRGNALHAAVSLEHLVGATTPGIGGNPFTSSSGVSGNPFTSSSGVSDPVGQYAVPGLGGRMPVRFVGAEPVGRLGARGSRPVVAVLDTVVGEHAWLAAPHVVRDADVLGVSLGLATDPSDVTGSADPVVGDLDIDAGHGTFIAGLVRQVCPDAVVLAVPVFHGDGIVAEGDLLGSLQRLALRHLLGVAGHPDYTPVDVVSLSLGYYHEQPEDVDFDALVRAPLALLGSFGVAVVASAGNDATLRPMYPGALAAYPGGPVAPQADVVPVSCVGARNPNGTVALFSNDGPWVLGCEPGAAVVSTFPTTVDTSGGPSAELTEADGDVRASIDLDDFTGGFALWSGTSFAAPILAGRIAAHLVDCQITGSGLQDTPVQRAWTALETLTDARRP